MGLIRIMKGPRKAAVHPRELDPDLNHMDMRRAALLDDISSMKADRERREASSGWPETERRRIYRRSIDRF